MRAMSFHSPVVLCHIPVKARVIWFISRPGIGLYYLYIYLRVFTLGAIYFSAWIVLCVFLGQGRVILLIVQCFRVRLPARSIEVLLRYVCAVKQVVD